MMLFIYFPSDQNSISPAYLQLSFLIFLSAIIFYSVLLFILLFNCVFQSQTSDPSWIILICSLTSLIIMFPLFFYEVPSLIFGIYFPSLKIAFLYKGKFALTFTGLIFIFRPFAFLSFLPLIRAISYFRSTIKGVVCLTILLFMNFFVHASISF